MIAFFKRLFRNWFWSAPAVLPEPALPAWYGSSTTTYCVSGTASAEELEHLTTAMDPMFEKMDEAFCRMDNTFVELEKLMSATFKKPPQPQAPQTHSEGR